jgi:hypothetical protein
MTVRIDQNRMRASSRSCPEGTRGDSPYHGVLPRGSKPVTVNLPSNARMPKSWVVSYFELVKIRCTFQDTYRSPGKSRMNARWVSHTPSPNLPLVAQTIIAKWWPGRYYLVSTIKLDPSSLLSRLTRSLQTSELLENVAPGPDSFISQVFKCDKHGQPRSFDKPLYEKEYPTESEAKTGHNETVRRLAKLPF